MVVFWIWVLDEWAYQGFEVFGISYDDIDVLVYL
jgi:hypothetical protein